MKDKIFIDSNIFLYAFDSSDIFKNKVASDIILNEKNFISVQVVNEVSNVMLKKINLSNIQIKQFIMDCFKKYIVVDITKNTFLKACDIREKYNISYYSFGCY